MIKIDILSFFLLDIILKTLKEHNILRVDTQWAFYFFSVTNHGGEIIIDTRQHSFIQDLLKDTFTEEYFLLTGILFAFDPE